MNVLEWARKADLGDRITYREGSFVSSDYSMDTALEAHEQGLVFLAMVRKGPERYLYTATRISTRCAKHLGIHPSQKPQSSFSVARANKAGGL